MHGSASTQQGKSFQQVASPLQLAEAQLAEAPPLPLSPHLKPHSVALQVTGLAPLPFNAKLTLQYCSAAAGGGREEHTFGACMQRQDHLCTAAVLLCSQPLIETDAAYSQPCSQNENSTPPRTRRGKHLPSSGGAGVADHVEAARLDCFLQASALRLSGRQVGWVSWESVDGSVGSRWMGQRGSSSVGRCRHKHLRSCC